MRTVAGFAQRRPSARGESSSAPNLIGILALLLRGDRTEDAEASSSGCTDGHTLWMYGRLCIWQRVLGLQPDLHKPPYDWALVPQALVHSCTCDHTLLFELQQACSTAHRPLSGSRVAMSGRRRLGSGEVKRRHCMVVCAFSAVHTSRPAKKLKLAHPFSSGSRRLWHFLPQQTCLSAQATTQSASILHHQSTTPPREERSGYCVAVCAVPMRPTGDPSSKLVTPYIFLVFYAS